MLKSLLFWDFHQFHQNVILINRVKKGRGEGDELMSPWPFHSPQLEGGALVFLVHLRTGFGTLGLSKDNSRTVPASAETVKPL